MVVTGKIFFHYFVIVSGSDIFSLLFDSFVGSAETLYWFVMV
jgi:hypothetical protein